MIGIRLTLTAPTIFEDYLWTDDHLKAREDTAAWAGAQQVFGTWRWNPEQFINQRNASGDDNKNTQEESKQETNTETSDQTTQPGSESNETEDNQTAEVNQEGDTTKKEGKGKHITFEEPTIEPKYRNKLYIQKLSIKKKTTSGPLTQDHGRKHRIFVKWRSPKLMKETIDEMEKEVTTHFRKMFVHLQKIDSSLIMLPWYEDNRKPLNPFLARF